MSFLGYPRQDGSVGARNHIGILSTTTCACDVAWKIASQVPGGAPFVHFQGCGHVGVDREIINRTLTNLGLNPNLAGVLLVGLGCETTKIDDILSDIAAAGKPVAKVVIQEIGGTAAAIAEGTRLATGMAEDATRLKRERFENDRLMFGCECGGSDATSGILSNPAIGAACDLLINDGGSCIFGEIPECIGAEHLLAKRGATPEISRAILAVVARYEKRIMAMGEDMRAAQPGAGNKAGGISTIEEKSLGAIAKGGTKTITQVCEYGARPGGKGMFLVDGPGHDSKSLTSFAAAGAQVSFFSTGRGSPIGFPFVPVIKVTANRATYERMKGDIDICLDQETDTDLASMGQRLYNEALEVASGKLTRAKQTGIVNFAGIWTIGPQM